MIQKYEILVDLEDVIWQDKEQFLDMVSNLCIGNELLTDISYKVIGCSEDGCIKLSVLGDDSEAVEFNYEENHPNES